MYPNKSSANDYEIEPPFDLQISPIFNVSDLYPFEDAGIHTYGVTLDEDDSTIDWQGRNLPSLIEIRIMENINGPE